MYDLQKDPHEMTDVSKDKKYSKALKIMKKTSHLNNSKKHLFRKKVINNLNLISHLYLSALLSFTNYLHTIFRYQKALIWPKLPDTKFIKTNQIQIKTHRTKQTVTSFIRYKKTALKGP